MPVLLCSILYLFSILPWATRAQPQTPPIYQIPLDTQQPLIARVGQLYSWTFLSGTFVSTSKLSYALSGNPSWVSLHDRTLTGTPSGTDIGQSSIIITATDSIGSINTGTMQLVVSSTVAPTIRIPLASQLANSTLGPSAVASDGSLRVAAGQAFSFTFAANSFDYSGQLYYTAVILGTASLPSWLSFDGNSQTLAGTPPKSLAPQTMTVAVDATDVQKFTGVDDQFNLTVYQHALTISQPVPNQNITQGTILNVVIPPTTFVVDGVPVTYANRTTAIPKLLLSSTRDGSGTLPSWLTFDPTSWMLKCTPDAHAGSMVIFILATDSSGDQLSSNFSLTVNGHAPPDQLIIIPDVYINSQTVNMKLPLATSDPISNSPLHYTASFRPQNGSAAWLQFNDTTNTVFGYTNSAAAQNITVFITGFDLWNGSASTCYHIFLQPALGSGSSNNSATRILAIVLPTVIGFGLLVLLSIYFYCFWRRKRTQQRQRFTGTSVIPPMAKPVAYNDPLPSSRELSEEAASDDRQEQLDAATEARNAEPQEYASRRLSSSAFPDIWRPEPSPNRTSIASGLSDITVPGPGTRPWSQVSTLRNSLRNITDVGETFSQMLAEEVKMSAAAKEAAWRKSLAFEASGDLPRGYAHGGHNLTERDISDLQIGEPLNAAGQPYASVTTNDSSTSASYITARSSQDTLSSVSHSLNAAELADLESALNVQPYSSGDAEFSSSGDTLPAVGISYPSGGILSYISRPPSNASMDRYNTFPTSSSVRDESETTL